MASNNVAQFAAELKMPAGVLLEQLQAAGVQKASEDDALSESDKARLLDHLRKSHGSADTDKRKITLTRRHTSEIKQSDATGKARTIQVEVRKKRVFVKRDEAGEGAADVGAAQEASTMVDDSAELQRREEEARREAELLEQQAQELRERQERLEREEAERQAREKAAEAERQRAEEEAAKKHAEAEKHAEAAARELLSLKGQGRRRMRHIEGSTPAVWQLRAERGPRILGLDLVFDVAAIVVAFLSAYFFAGFGL